MKLSQLASLVTVRNHLFVVIGDRNVINKNEVKQLDEIRRNLDRKFIEAVKALDLDNLDDQPKGFVKTGSVSDTVVVATVDGPAVVVGEKQLDLPFNKPGRPKKK
jgi:hypothetical protein